MKMLPIDQNSQKNWQKTLFLQIFVRNLQKMFHKM